MSAKGKVTVSIDFDDSGAMKSMTVLDTHLDKKVAPSARRVGVAGDKAFKLMAVGAFAAAAAVGSLTAAMVAIVKSTADYADNLAKKSRQLGVSVELLSEMNLAAKLGGASLDSLATGLRRLAVNAVDASRGTGEARHAFVQLGITVTDTEGKLKSQRELLLEVADRFAALPDGIHKTAAAQRIFGRSGSELIPVLNKGAQGLDEIARKARSMGLALTAEGAVAAERFKDNLTLLSGTLEGLKIRIGMATIPALNTLFDAFSDGSEGAEELTSRIDDFSHVIVGAGKMTIEFAADVNQMTASALRSSAALLTLSARTYDFIGARKTADRAMLESLALSATAEEFERRAQGLLDRAGGLYERHARNLAENARRAREAAGATEDYAEALEKAGRSASKFGVVAMPIPGFGRSFLPPSLRSEEERLEAARRAGLESHEDMMYRPGTAGLPTPLLRDEDRMRFESLVPPPEVLEAGISSMRTFQAGMSGILGDLRENFGAYQLAILGVADAWEQFVTGQESFGAAMRKAAASAIAALSKESAVRSMMHTAQGVAAMFSPWALAQYGPPSQNFKAAALFAAAAGASGAAARAVGGSAGVGERGGPFNPISTREAAVATMDLSAGRTIASLGAQVAGLNQQLARIQTQPAGVVTMDGVRQAGGAVAVVRDTGGMGQLSGWMHDEAVVR